MAKAEKGRFGRIARAKAICMTCPDIERCLLWALETKQPYGVWGSSTERDRRVLLRLVAAGRPVETVVHIALTKGT